MRKTIVLVLMVLMGVQNPTSLFAHVPPKIINIINQQNDVKLFNDLAQLDANIVRDRQSSVDRKKMGFVSRLKNKLIRFYLKMAKGKVGEDRPFHWAAITSLVCGALSILLFITFLPAIIFGVIGLLKTGPNKKYQGMGMALAGLGLGLLFGLLFILYVALIVTTI